LINGDLMMLPLESMGIRC